MTEIPSHVPPELVRSFDFDFRGPIDELFPRFDALQDTSLFSSAFDLGAIAGGASIPPMIPIFLDPPEHTGYRRDDGQEVRV